MYFSSLKEYGGMIITMKGSHHLNWRIYFKTRGVAMCSEDLKGFSPSQPFSQSKQVFSLITPHNISLNIETETNKSDSEIYLIYDRLSSLLTYKLMIWKWFSILFFRFRWGGARLRWYFPLDAQTFSVVT